MALAAVILITGCGSGQNTAAPATGSTVQAQADTQTDTPEASPADAGTAEAASPAEAAAEGSEGAKSADGQDNTASGAAKAPETVTIVIPTLYESVTTQEEADRIREENGYESAILGEDGSLTVVMSRSQHEQILDQFKKSVDEGLAEIINTVEDSAIEKIEYNDDYSVFTVTVPGSELSFGARQAADELIMYGTLYHIYSGNDADRIQVEYVMSGSGEIIETADSGSLDTAY